MYVVENSKNVTISYTEISLLTEKIILEHKNQNKINITSWDEHGWHYTKVREKFTNSV